MSETELQRYDFSAAERLDMGERLARLQLAVIRAKETKKDQTKALGEQIKDQEKEIEKLASALDTGYELREVKRQTGFAFGELRSVGDVVADIGTPKRERKQ